MNHSYPPTPWIVRRPTGTRARLRLFCFPYAGAGAVIYNRWPSSFPPDVEVCAVEPPGRLVRHKEPSPLRMSELIAGLDDALAPYLDLPFAVFGYSMGALTGFEWCRSLRRRLQRQPQHIVVAAAGAPHLSRQFRPMAQLPQAEFLRELDERYGAIDPRIAADPELLSIVVQIMRRDLQLLEDYVHQDEPPFACPLAAIGGTADAGVPADRLTAWQHHCSVPLRTELFEGGHFFIRDHEAKLIELVRQIVC